jgi:hypothetical protein
MPAFLFFFIRQETFRRDARANFAGTAGQLRVPSGVSKIKVETGMVLASLKENSLQG